MLTQACLSTRARRLVLMQLGVPSRSTHAARCSISHHPCSPAYGVEGLQGPGQLRHATRLRSCCAAHSERAASSLQGAKSADKDGLAAVAAETLVRRYRCSHHSCCGTVASSAPGRTFTLNAAALDGAGFLSEVPPRQAHCGGAIHCCPSKVSPVRGILHDPHSSSTITIWHMPRLVSCTSLLHSQQAAYRCLVVSFLASAAQSALLLSLPGFAAIGQLLLAGRCRLVQLRRCAATSVCHVPARRTYAELLSLNRAACSVTKGHPCPSAASLIVQLRQVIPPARMHKDQQCLGGRHLLSGRRRSEPRVRP